MIGIVIQARTGSTRFPGKVLKKINNQFTVIEYILNTLKLVSSNVSVVVATSSAANDDLLEEVAHKANVNCFRGSEKDVLDRFYQAATKFKLKTIVRIPSDNPFILPSLINSMLKKWAENRRIDYLSNTIGGTYPVGMHVEIFSFNSLQKAWREAYFACDREHVTPFIYNTPKFKLLSYDLEKDLSRYRFTIDYPDDLKFARRLNSVFDVDAQTTVEDLCKVVDSIEGLFELNSNFKKEQAIFRK